MRVRPADRFLQDRVKLVERKVRWNEDPAPNRRADIFQRDLQLKDGDRRGGGSGGAGVSIWRFGVGDASHSVRGQPKNRPACGHGYVLATEEAKAFERADGHLARSGPCEGKNDLPWWSGRNANGLQP